VKREDVIRLHGRVCWICKKKIGELPHPHPQSLSLDHIVPLSLGGWHHISNLKPAHLSCNSTKGDRYTGQLMLKLTPAR
jgi:5-methylcytosine-specific restriction endonuclease McrA